MCSKVLSLIISASVLLLGCDLKTHESPPAPRMAKFVAGDKVGCLTRTTPYLSAFFGGHQKGIRVGEFWDCAASALEVFAEKSEGDLKDGFSTQALIRFLETYFVEDEAKIEDTLATEIMRIKQLFVGGDLNSFKKSELSEFILVIKKFGSISQSLAPYMKVYVGKWEPSHSILVDDEVKYFENANIELQIFAREIADLIRKDSPDYRIDYLFNLIQSMRPRMSIQWVPDRGAQDIAALLKKVKVALTGGDEDIITPKEWRRFLLIGFRGFTQALRFKYFVSNIERGRSQQILFLARTIDDTFSMMADLVVEKPEQSISIVEVAAILEKLSLAYPSFKYSDELLSEIMKIKVVFFGGSPNYWSVEEFLSARRKIKVFRDMTLKLVPYLPIFDGTWDPSTESSDEARRYFYEGHKTLFAATQELGKVFEDDYALSDANKLIDAIAILYPEDFSDISKMSKDFLEPLTTYKNIILSDQGDVIRSHAWSYFLGSSVRLLEQMQFYKYFLKNKEPRIGDSLQNFDYFVKSLTSLGLDLLSRKKDQVLDDSEVQRLIFSLKEIKGFESEEKRKGFFALYLILKDRFLTAPDSRLKREKPRFFGETHLKEFRLEYSRWSAGQKMISDILQGDAAAQLSHSEIMKSLKSKFPTGNSIFDKSIAGLFLALDSRFPLLIESNGTLLIDYPPSSDAFFNLESLSQLNLNVVIVDLLLKGYSPSLVNIEKRIGFSTEDFEGLIKDVMPVLVQLGVFSDYKETYAKGRMLEANLFTFRGNGDERFDFVEAIDYLPLLYSAANTDQRLKRDLIDQCHVVEQKNKFLSRVDLSCYRNHFIANYQNYFSQLKVFIESWAPVEKNKLLELDTFEQASGFKSYDEYNTVLLKEVTALSSVLQYLDIIMVRFDTNQDGILNTKESLNAFPIFRAKIKEVSKFKKDSMAEALFTYLLKFGEPPKKSLGGYRKLLKWKNSRDSWNIRADRLQLSKILISLQPPKKQ